MYCTDLIYPRLSHDDVVNDDSGSPPGVVTLASVEDKMAAAHRVTGNILPPKADGHGPLLPEDPLPVLNIVSKHRRMVANLYIHVGTWTCTCTCKNFHGHQRGTSS